MRSLLLLSLGILCYHSIIVNGFHETTAYDRCATKEIQKAAFVWDSLRLTLPDHALTSVSWANCAYLFNKDVDEIFDEEEMRRMEEEERSSSSSSSQETESGSGSGSGSGHGSGSGSGNHQLGTASYEGSDTE